MSIIHKMNKKFFSVLAVIAALFTLAACTGEPSAALAARREATDSINEVLDNIIFTEPDAIVNNLELVKQAKMGVVVTWTSSDANVIKLEDKVIDSIQKTMGIVTRPPFEQGDAKVRLVATATVEYSYLDKNGTEITKTVSAFKEFNLTIKSYAEGQNILPIASIKTPAIADNQEVGIKGVVTGTFDGTKGGFYVTDATATVYVFKTYTDDALKIGDEVEVYGKKTFYYGAPQIGGTVSFKVLSNNNAIPAATPVKLSEVATTPKTDVSIVGNRYKSYGYLIYQQDGANYNYYIADPSTGDRIQIYYRTYNAETTDLQNYKGKYVNIVYTVYYYDDRIPMWSVDYTEMAGSIEEAAAPTLTDAEKAAMAEKNITVFASLEATSNAKVTLPTAVESYGATITWETTDAHAIISEKDGVFTLTWGSVSENTATVIKANIKVGDHTLVKEYHITLKPLVPISVAQFIATPLDQVVALEGVIHLYADGSYLIDSEGNSVLIYKFKGAKHGDRVIISGARKEFQYTPQMQNAVIIKTISEGNKIELAPTPMTIDEIHAVDFKTTKLWGKYIAVTGTVVADGIYYNLEDNGKIISLYQSNANVLKDLVGKKVTINVYFYGISKTDGTGVWRMIFTGYEGEFELAEMTVEDKLDAVAAALPIKNNQEVSANITFPLTGEHGATISWTSNNAAINAETGVVTRGDENVNVILTAVIQIGEKTKTVEITVVVLAKPAAETLSVTEFIALAKGEVASIQGVIYLYDDGSYIIDSEGNGLLVYKFKGAKHGDLVVISGKRDVYNNTPQMAAAELVKTISEGNGLGLTPVAMTIAEVQAINLATSDLFGKYIKLTGKVVPDGSFYAILDEATGKQISFYFSNNEVLGAHLGLNVTLNVFFYGNSKADGTGLWRVVFGGYEGELTDNSTVQDKINVIKAALEIKEGQEITTDLVLPTTAKFGATIAWGSDNLAINPATGVVTRPANGSGDVNVKLTATITIGEVSEEVIINVVVKEEAAQGGVSSSLNVDLKGTTTSPLPGWEYKVDTKPYGDGSLKLSANGHYVLSEEVTIAGNVNFEIHLKANGGPSASGVVSLQGIDATGTVVETVSHNFSFEASAEFDFTGVLTNTSIKRIKVIYTTKTLGNLGVYTVKLNA